jgi:hypothetical protein
VSLLRENQMIPPDTKEIIVAATDAHDGDAYVQTPPYVALEFINGRKFAWDFREKLQLGDGRFPDIHQVFIDAIRITTGGSLTTWGQYGHGMFLFRLPVEKADRGGFQITVGDTAGNQSTFDGMIPQSESTGPTSK